MKKRIVSLLLTAVLLLSLSCTAFAAGTITVTINGTTVRWTDAEPFIDANSRTMVPLRAVAEAMGLRVDWDGSAREAIFTDGSRTVYFPINSQFYRTGSGETVTMDTAAVIVNDRTYAPIRYLAEFFGYNVGWDGATRTVLITGAAGAWVLVDTQTEGLEDSCSSPGYTYLYSHRELGDTNKYSISCTFTDNDGTVTGHYVSSGECSAPPAVVQPDQKFYLNMKVYTEAVSGWLEPWGILGMGYIVYDTAPGHYGAYTYGFENTVEGQPAAYNAIDGNRSWQLWATFPEGVSGETIRISCTFHMGSDNAFETTWTYAWRTDASAAVYTLPAASHAWVLTDTRMDGLEDTSESPGYSFHYYYRTLYPSGGKYSIECTFVDNDGKVTAHYIASGERSTAPEVVYPDQIFHMNMKVYTEAVSGWLEPWGILGMGYIMYDTAPDHYGAYTYGFDNVVEGQPAAYNAIDGNRSWQLWATFPEGVSGETIRISCTFHMGSDNAFETTWTYTWFD